MNRKKTPLKGKYDVVIIGAGPAGASTAKALNGHGLDTVIIENLKLPRYKMCSGILLPSAIKFISENFGNIPAKAMSNPINVRGTRTYLGIGTPFIELPFSRKDLLANGLNTKRPELDYWLCSCSNAVIIDQCKFKDYREQKNEITIRLEMDNDQIEITTNYLVGADGTLSKVRKVTFPTLSRGINLIPVYEEWYFGEIDLEPQWLHVFFDRQFTGFFASVFQKDNKIILVNGVKEQESAKDYFRNFVKYLIEKHRLIIREKVAGHGCVLHDMAAAGNFYIGRRNVLLVGEAGGFIRGAEGITSALITGKAAGESILKSIDTGGPSFDFYLRAVSGEIEACKKTNQFLERTFGVNPFTRQ